MNYNKLYHELQNLIYSENNTEIQCREYLQYVPEFLFNQFKFKEIIKFDSEHRQNTGNTDYITSALIEDDAKGEKTIALIWELKAPQCYIFKEDTNNRAIPTTELIKAENQLLHYYHEFKSSEHCRCKFSVMSSDDVLFGGIIIGREDRKISGKGKAELFDLAYQIRTIYFYRNYQIRLLTWDTILRNFLSNRNIEGNKSITLIPEHNINTVISSSGTVISNFRCHNCEKLATTLYNGLCNECFKK